MADKLEQEVSEYAKLAKENSNIDVASLMLHALNEKSNKVSSKMKWWVYMLSVGLPMVGFLFAAYYYFFSDKDDAQQVANICIFLSILCVGIFWITGKIMLSGSGTSLNQIEQITPQEIHDTIQ